MTSPSEKVFRQYESAKERQDLYRRALQGVATLQGMADRALAGKQLVLDSITAEEGVYEQADLSDIDAKTGAIKDSLQAVIDRIDEVLALGQNSHDLS